MSGYKVVTLAVNLPGPAAVAEFVRLGARVVKVEPPAGDMLAWSQPTWFAELHRGVEIVRLNLKESGDRAALDRQLSDSDLLVTSNRPSALARLGLGWSNLHESFPRLCQVAIVGYPGENEDLPGHDLTYQAHLGLVKAPDMPRTLIADLAGALRATMEGVGLLLARERTGTAGYVAVSLSESARLFAQPLRYGLTTPGGGLGGGLPGYRLYRAKKGWVAVAALEPHFLENLRLALGLADANHDTLERAMALKTDEEWESWANERGLPIAALRDVPQLDDPIA